MQMLARSWTEVCLLMTRLMSDLRHAMQLQPLSWHHHASDRKALGCARVSQAPAIPRRPRVQMRATAAASDGTGNT